MSEKQTESGESIEEQREWIAEQVDAVEKATGSEGAWVDGWGDELDWDGDRDAILELAGEIQCSFDDDKPNPGALELHVNTRPLDEDPFPLADRVKQLWTSEGWTVSDIVRIDDLPNRDEVSFKAERDDGAMLMLTATAASGGRLLFLTVQASCSDHPSLAWGLRGASTQ
ncbi:MAG: hypothetical protein ACK5LO_05260 [Leucobacter sp.]